MNEYTIIYCTYGIYSSNKIKIKKIMSSYGLKWNPSKYTDLSVEETLNSYKIFGHLDKMEKDGNLNGRTSSTGIWEKVDKSAAVKAIMLEKKNEDEHLPVILIYKGDETSECYKELVAYCVKLGCWISKVVESEGVFEVIFKKRINIELVDRLDSVEGKKEVLKEMFQSRINSMRSVGGGFNEKFVKAWKECIEKYSDYTRVMLYTEIEKASDTQKMDKACKVAGVRVDKIIDEKVFKVVNNKIIKVLDDKVIDNNIFKRRTFKVKMKKGTLYS